MENTPSKMSAEERRRLLEMVDAVDELGEDTKDLALNLALYLARAKAKNSSEQLAKMEPEFIKLVNTTVKVIQELAVVLKAARNQEKMIYQPPSGTLAKDRLESRLEMIVKQCNDVLETLAKSRDIVA
jgi:hypothetical protein